MGFSVRIPSGSGLTTADLADCGAFSYVVSRGTPRHADFGEIDSKTLTLTKKRTIFFAGDRFCADVDLRL